ncbi:MAG: tRNA1(Val) (adenine(37)-N6)-methyltransferase [Alphaproteobacteria bacterium]
MTAASATQDRLLGGRVLLQQPTDGYRAAIDPVLLAAAVPALPRGRVLDLGAGAGAAALCYAARVPGPQVIGLELQPDLAALARENAAANGVPDRVRFLAGDLLHPPPELAPDSFDHAMANPPFLEASRADPSPQAAKAAADVEGAARLADWIELALALVRPKGGITLIHRADRLDEILARLYGHAGETVVIPLWPHEGEAAKRVIVRARKGLRTPLRLSAGLVLHGADGAYTAAARAVLYDAAPLSI